MLFKTPQDLSPCQEHVDNITNRAKYSLSPPVWGTYIVSLDCSFFRFGFLFGVYCYFWEFYFERQAAEVLRKLSPGQPAVGGTFTWFQHKKMDWSEEDNVSWCSALSFPCFFVFSGWNSLSRLDITSPFDAQNSTILFIVCWITRLTTGTNQLSVS